MQSAHEDVVVVPTGAASGIGRAAVAEFDRRGSKLVFAARDAEELERVPAAWGCEVGTCATDVGEAARSSPGGSSSALGSRNGSSPTVASRARRWVRRSA